MQELIASLISFFLSEPLGAEVADKLAAARAPQAVLTDVATCVREAQPVIIRRATQDPWWAASNIVYVWIGAARPEDVLVETAPACRPAIEAARPFLGKGQS